YLNGNTPCDIICFTSLMIGFCLHKYTICLSHQAQRGFLFFLMVDWGNGEVRNFAKFVVFNWCFVF
ncbi:hypothetical protein, partial [Desulfobacula sp.]|uniref:hypothetical protein n=1 Tax=Desulfobacula sp. TaxID=2593537 RepID=UPI0039B83ED0